MLRNKLNFAIIGCGKIALDHASIIKKLGHKIIFGVTKRKNSKNWIKFTQKYPETKFLSINKIISNKKIDRIVSCLPLNENKKVCKKLLLSKIPVLIEKPIHDNYGELKKILNDKRLFLSNKILAYNRRHYKVTKILKKKVLRSKLKNIEVNIAENFDLLKKKYKKNPKSFFLHVGASSHIIDLIYFLLGNLKIEKIWKNHSKNKKSFLIILKSNLNIPIIVNINNLDPLNAIINFRFKDDTLWRLSPIEELRIFKFNKRIKVNSNFYKKKYEPKLLKFLQEDKSSRPGFYDQMKNFIKGNYKKMYNIQDNLNLIKLFNKIDE